MPENEIITTKDGSHSLLSQHFGVSYHSIHGAIQESQHVFINAALRYKAVLKTTLSILEIGLGTGLNAFMTFLESKKRNLNLDYIGYEFYPISIETANTLNYPLLLQAEEESSFFTLLHTCDWETSIVFNEHFSFIKKKKEFETIDVQNQYDIIYFDAFAPNAQPELWEIPFLQKMYNALKDEGVLVTYCAKGEFKRNLKKIGFDVEALAGPPGKREMTRASKEKNNNEQL